MRQFQTVATTPACSDGADNDGDGFVDHAGGDPGCDSPGDLGEHARTLPCDDGIDNDGDGLIDYVAGGGGDAECFASHDRSEAVNCSDGIDNDGDELLDLDDPDCTDPSDPLEAHDEDGDLVEDGLDNCPYEPNGTIPQADTGGVGLGSAPDGIGDACQCGDINNSGVADGIDYLLLNRSSLGLPPYGSLAGMPGFRKCNVNGGAGGVCDGIDGLLINRASLSLPPGIFQDCLAANP
jgi:hypothetical protein